MKQAITYGGVTAEPGTKATGWTPIFNTNYKLPVTVINGTKPGKAVLITSAIHGCEYPSIEAVFELILTAAVKNTVPQDELPSKLIIISDMEFDCCVEHSSLSNFKNAEKKYAQYGYRLPEIVFWNVASRNSQQPVTMNEQGVALVSGCTPQIFGMLKNDSFDPYTYMMEILSSARYERIAA